MNARQIIEAEDPKAVFRRLRGSADVELLIDFLKNVQGMLEELDSGNAEWGPGQQPNPPHNVHQMGIAGRYEASRYTKEWEQLAMVKRMFGV